MLRFIVPRRLLQQPKPLIETGFARQTRHKTHHRNKARPQGPRNTVRRPPQPSPLPKRPENSPAQAEGKASSTDAVSDALRNADPQENNLLAPVYIPEDSDGVLNEKHPAAALLANSAIVVQRQLELMNVMLGFEQANKYIILNGQGEHIGYIAERELGMGNMMARQMFSTHRSFTAHVFDKHEKEILRFHRPFSWISSRIGVYDPLQVAAMSHSASTALQNPTAGSLSSGVGQTPAQVSPLALSDMRIIGEAQQQWAPLRRKYNLFLYRQSPNRETDLGTRPISAADLPISSSQQLQVSEAAGSGSDGEFGQFAYVDEPFLSWDFSLLSADQRLIGSVNRNFAGFGREIFTDTGVYALRMDAANLADEPRHLISKTGEKAERSPHVGMTLDQRAVMLATAVSIDFDYFSRHSGSGGMGFMPLWFPGMGGGAAAGEAAEGAGAVEGAAGGVAGGAGGIGEGAVVGAGSAAGYEAMQRSTSGAPSSDSPGFGAGQAPPPPSQSGEAEDVWGEDDDLWSGGKRGSGGNGGEGGEGGWDGGGGGGDDSDDSDWF